MDSSEPSFWDRHSFAIRRLHSLSGLIPVGGYMVIHLVVNASVLNSAGQLSEQRARTSTSSAPCCRCSSGRSSSSRSCSTRSSAWSIVAGGLPNTHNYPYEANYRYTLQRVTGVIAFVFIALHVFHMHGWFHDESWVEYVVEPLGRRAVQAVQRHEHRRAGAAADRVAS